MKYRSGEEIQLGDCVSLGGGMTGSVVAILDTRSFLSGYSEEEWMYLGAGVLVSSPEAGLVHYPDPTDRIEFLERGRP